METMKTSTIKGIFAVLLAMAICASVNARRKKSAPTPPPKPLTAVGQKLEADYSEQLKSLKAEIEKALSDIDEKKKGNYLNAVKNFKDAKSRYAAAGKAQNAVKNAENKLKRRHKAMADWNKKVAEMEESLKKATSEKQRKAFKGELARRVRLRKKNADALKKEEKALAQAKAAEINNQKKLKAAEEALLQAKEEVLSALKEAGIAKFVFDGALDDKLVKYVVLHEATPRGLAEFAEKGPEQVKLVEQMLADTGLMRQMLIADGAKSAKKGPAQYGQAMKIYTDIQKASAKAKDGLLQRLALAIALEHAIPIAQQNPRAAKDAPKYIDPVKRYLHYEKAYLDDELDPAFKDFSTWELRMVVNGNEPDETSAWGREMLRNYHPDHIRRKDYGWRYVRIIGTDVPYNSSYNYRDLPELQNYQNILMNGGICGRRAFFGRFILRAFGIPTTARPSRAHAALTHWTPKGWVVNLGPGWGKGWTHTKYNKDLDFLATTRARAASNEYLKVKRAQWIGDAEGERRFYGEQTKGKPGFWNGLSLNLQKVIIDTMKVETLAALGEDIGEATELKETEKVEDISVKPEEKKITYNKNGVISIPAAAFSKPANNTSEVQAMDSFSTGKQVYLKRVFPKGMTILRGGTWKAGENACNSEKRLLSAGYGRYSDWGFRAAMSCDDKDAPREVTLDLGNGIKMDFVYIKPGKFTMGGTNSKGSKYTGVNVPKHEVTITKGFYMGKYEVTQAQFEAIMDWNPSDKKQRNPDAPVDTVSEPIAFQFCKMVARKTGKPVRLPTEAEWEYASRAGSDTPWFFGSDPSQLGDYAWCKSNSGGKTHPVGQKKPNPWGLYDIYGNVCERVSDRYSADYYAKSPKQDPTGYPQGKHCRFEYTLEVPQAGTYALTAKVVTVKHDQQLFVSANDESETNMTLPFTCGKWQDSKPVNINLKKGKNVLGFYRTNPPQKGIALKSFVLKPTVQ